MRKTEIKRITYMLLGSEILSALFRQRAVYWCLFGLSLFFTLYLLKETTGRKAEALENEEAGKENLKEQKSELELRLLQNQTTVIMLQSQINPHFLYNTLDCIRGEASLLGADELADMIKALAQFFSYSIRKSGICVTVGEELENIKNYFMIQQFRFGQRFRLNIIYDESDTETMENVIPRLTLQPIVENAILHAFGDEIADCQIRIYIFKTDKNLCIRCSDNGCGMTPRQLEQLHEKLRETMPDEVLEQPVSGIGLQNINSRIRLIFGKDYGLAVSSMEGAGTDIEIRLPVQNKVVEQ
ncbi:MAG: histidine kinase [Eubacteriales bacterium]|nr:histidine kinase [Eubacteriales bacterium]